MQATLVILKSGRGIDMFLDHLKYQTCPYDKEDGVLMTDIDEENPETDDDGDLQYYCTSGRHTFSYHEDDED
jgi:hypothetical protein